MHQQKTFRLRRADHPPQKRQHKMSDFDPPDVDVIKVRPLCKIMAKIMAKNDGALFCERRFLGGSDPLKL